MTTDNIFDQGPISFVDGLRHPRTAKRALSVSLIVGTILIAINQGDLIMNGQFPSIWKVMLTYFVPYCVSSYSSAAFLSELSQKLSGDRNGKQPE